MRALASRRSLSLVAAGFVLLGAALAVWLVSSGRFPPSPSRADAELYGCPMPEDAEVRSTGPGQCPKCGMDLVPLADTEHKGKPPPGNSTSPAPGVGGSAGSAKPRAIYHCPMHPSYTSDKPGECPICNMTLVKLEEPSRVPSAQVEDRAVVRVSERQRQLIGVKTAPAERLRISTEVRAVARIEYDERTLATVSLKYGGWIEELFVAAAGDRVRKGAPLLAIYSPELLEAQGNYLAAFQALASAKGAMGQGGASGVGSGVAESLERAVQVARERLELLDLSEAQIRELEASREPSRGVMVFSRVEGVVTERAVERGAYAPPGAVLYRIADLSKVWAIAQVYEMDLPLVRPGAFATITVPLVGGESVAGRVDYVYPYLDRTTRTALVRVVLENSGERLKPGMYGTASIASDLGEQLVIEDSAVLDSGARQIVFVELEEGLFEPREIRVGVRSGGRAVVLEGLREGERVVTSGTFLIDSESRLKAALARFGAARSHAGAHAEGPAEASGRGRRESTGEEGRPRDHQGH